MPFQIIRNDITKVRADAIVNTANPKPIIGGGTDSAIYAAAGKDRLLAERKKIGDIVGGDATVTPAFDLQAKYIIHTVGPVWENGDHGEFETLRSCYSRSLALAQEYNCESIAFPLISTGVYGFPRAEALRIAISVFSEFLAENEMQITLVVFDEESFEVSGKIFSGIDAYIDENYVSEQIDEEYGSASMTDRERRSFPQNIFHRRAESSVGMAPKPVAEDSIEEASAYEIEEAVMYKAMPKPIRSFDDLMSHIGETWQESLFRWIDEKGYTDTEVYKRANVDRKLFSKIRSNSEYQPKKITALAFALALELNLDETKDMLGRAGYALSPSSKFDLIIEYFIEQEVYDTYTINLALFDHKQPLLGE